MCVHVCVRGVPSLQEESTKFTAGGLELDREDSRKARMLYDYDAVNGDEISINSQEVGLCLAWSWVEPGS